jgi:UDP:flavonoid glycosyltransferase YjiC (YdhE family)
MLYRVREKQRLAFAINQAAWQISQGSDAIVARMSAFLDAFSIAEKLAVPCFEIGLDPQIPTGAFPNTDFFQTPDWPGFYNRATFTVVEQVNWQIFRAVTNRFRREVLGLRRFSFFGPAAQKRAAGRPVLHAFSPVVVPRPADWPGDTKITGFWFLDESQSWRPPSSLLDFLHGGPPPVYVGFGSMADQNPGESFEIARAALEQVGQRGIWMGDPGGTPGSGPVSPRMYCLESAPHDWLFPRMAAIVHHGGAGTTAASLRAGAPTIIVPHLYDQPFWGKRVEKLGAGPKPIPHKQLTVEKLVQALRAALCDSAIQQKAAAVGEAIRAEDGVACAVEIIGGASR